MRVALGGREHHLADDNEQRVRGERARDGGDGGQQHARPGRLTMPWREIDVHQRSGLIQHDGDNIRERAVSRPASCLVDVVMGWSLPVLGRR